MEHEIIRGGPELYDQRNYERPAPKELPTRAAHINRTSTAKAVEQFCGSIAARSGREVRSSRSIGFQKYAGIVLPDRRDV